MGRPWRGLAAAVLVGSLMWAGLFFGVRSALAEESNTSRFGSYTLAPVPSWWSNAAYTLTVGFPSGTAAQYRVELACWGGFVTSGPWMGGQSVDATMSYVEVPPPHAQCLSQPVSRRYLILYRQTTGLGSATSQVAMFFPPGGTAVDVTPSPTVAPSVQPVSFPTPLPVREVSPAAAPGGAELDLSNVEEGLQMVLVLLAPLLLVTFAKALLP